MKIFLKPANMANPSFCSQPCLVLLLTGVLALTLTACGGSSNKGSGGAASSSSNSSSPPIISSSSVSSSSSSASSVSSAEWVQGIYRDSSEYKDYCETPRVGYSQYTGIAFPDKQGTLLDEKNFLRSWSHETYLWFGELPDIDPTFGNSAQEYFSWLVTHSLTESGSFRDNFHFSEPTEYAEAWDAGVTYSYGMKLRYYSVIPPRAYYVAYVEPGSPAANAGIIRGTKILEINGYDLVHEESMEGIMVLSDGLNPIRANAINHFTLLEPEATAPRKVTLQSADIAISPVLTTKVLENGNDRVGYIVFNSHIQKAQDQWVTAIRQLKQAGVNDVILDLRYNGGGLLSIASQVSYMLAGSNIQSEVFYEQLENSKKPVLEPFPFLDFGLYGENQYLDLPTLDLKRVFILSSRETCSASEAIINGLRGADIPVYLIGDTTCGKPYGYYPEPNCGTTYYTIQLAGVNAKGFGEYSDGFSPATASDGKTRVEGCFVDDDLNHELGDPKEAILATALAFRATGSCPTVSSTMLIRKAAPADKGSLMVPETQKLLKLR
ncbi:S41 family peptidase [Cellvibrio polysaccharolyticus]|uniref:Peptidase n=1 Tax=Cellvibrio polysaccharolyticus TaxID=2082724 RepID=A0A928V3U7_9GAMM|nr:S41 family peptidase [Cellvibrio polysaccharolyticus]MBE8718268.1 peptidase [Cellvibrio polysaccharolyticus]